MAPALKHEGLRIRLAPTRAQHSYLLGCAGAARTAYNFALEQILANQQTWTAEREAGVEAAKRTKPLSDRQLQDVWHAKKAIVAPWHGEYPSKIYLYALRRARAAHQSFIARRSGFPRFKAKRRDAPSFTVCETIALAQASSACRVWAVSGSALSVSPRPTSARPSSAGSSVVAGHASSRQRCVGMRAGSGGHR